MEEKKIKPAPFVIPMHRMYTLSSEKRILCVSYRNSRKVNAAIDKAIRQKHISKEEEKLSKSEEKHHSDVESQSVSPSLVWFSYNKEINRHISQSILQLSSRKPHGCYELHHQYQDPKPFRS